MVNQSVSAVAERVAWVRMRGGRRYWRERRPRQRLPYSSDPRIPAGGRKFTEFRLFASCLLGQEQLAAWLLFNHFDHLIRGCTKTSNLGPAD
jgi:hypothetical protein